MAAVKGSKQYRLKVVKDRPWLDLLSALAIVLLIIAIAQGAFWVGHKKGMAGQGKLANDMDALRQELAGARAEATDLRQRLANVTLGSEVDRKANEAIRQEVIELKANVAELQEENGFYRNLMAPQGNQRGLSFGVVEIIDTNKPRSYKYKVVMQQLATNHELLVGTLSFNIVGRQDGAVMVLPLREISADVDSTNIKLRFKYFQTVEGEMVLPEGFEPERIELQARSSGKDSVTIEKRFGWLVQKI